MSVYRASAPCCAISEVMADLCRFLGLDPATVASLDITGTEIIASVYLTDATGRRYLAQGTAEAATIDWRYLRKPAPGPQWVVAA